MVSHPVSHHAVAAAPGGAARTAAAPGYSFLSIPTKTAQAPPLATILHVTGYSQHTMASIISRFRGTCQSLRCDKSSSVAAGLWQVPRKRPARVVKFIKE